MPLSEVEAFHAGRAFDDWRKVEEAKAKMQGGIAERLNGVIRACGIIAKTVSHRR
jgi:hypothetical protein